MRMNRRGRAFSAVAPRRAVTRIRMGALANRSRASSCLAAGVFAVWLVVPAVCSAADPFPMVTDVDQQPLVAATERLIEALDFIGAPLTTADRQSLTAAMQDADGGNSIAGIQQVLDRYCAFGVTIKSERQISVVQGPAPKQLVQQGWRTFLVKVHNLAGPLTELKIESPSLAPLFKPSSNEPSPASIITIDDAPVRWLDAIIFNSHPLKRGLTGLPLEYCVLQLYSRDAGKRHARIGFFMSQRLNDFDYPNAISVEFDCLPSVEVVLRVRDFDGQPTTAAFVIRDKFARVYPNPARRLAPDFYFQNQVYRSDGESVHLAPGDYAFEVSRGPEYLVETHKVTVGQGPLGNVATTKNFASQSVEFKIRRWIHPAERGWMSGDHHIHAAGCRHYDNPTEGVTPADMMRHVLGEDLNVGCVLSWGPCWYSQKRFFEGRTSALSRPNSLMRYDIEVSGFPSSHAGHLCLLGLTEDDYPGTDLIDQWPSWTGPVLEWARRQGAVVGYAHSGWGMQLPDVLPDGSREFVSVVGVGNTWIGKAAHMLPDYELPRFDGIGANEYIVTVANGLVDFMSTADTPAFWELNTWYHTLNCGMTPRISGETDFPCIRGDRVGLGRVYVKLRPDERLTYDAWLQGLKHGRSYCGDGMSHILDFRVGGVNVGEPGSDGKISQLTLDKPGTVKVDFDAAAFLASDKPTPQTESIRKRRLDEIPYWHIERARQGDSRDVLVEVVVNGHSVATKMITADGNTNSLSFDIPIRRSSWVVVRIIPSVHTNPVFVEVGGQPIRPSRKSAEWCLKAVDVCWNSKADKIRPSEKAAAKAAYDKAREVYAAILKEAGDE